MKDNKDLHTTFCHKCGLWMEFPYEENDKLYHQWCLPQSEIKQYPIILDETMKFIDPEAYFNREGYSL